jgi:hypothetical protein
MIVVDSNESPEYDKYISPVVECSRENINQKPGQIEILPDFMIYNGGKIAGGNHKQIGEIIGQLDEFEEQLQREIMFADCDYFFILIDGVVTVEPDGTCQIWKKGKNVWIPGFHYNTQYNRLARVLDMCWTRGIPVIRTTGVWENCLELIALHNSMGIPDGQHETFNRFIKKKFFINRQEDGESDEDWTKRAKFIKTLISIDSGGLGEEAAVSLSLFFQDMYSLMQHMMIESIAELPMKSGRRIGPAIDQKLRNALGVPLFK